LSEAVLDSSAILALIFNEPGAEKVKATLPDALLSTINLAEIITKLVDRGLPADVARAAVEVIGAEIVDFDIGQAFLTGELRVATRAAGLSLGDRACLALAAKRNLPAMTADRAWGKLENFDVIVIRGTG
jgi:PIN domain nuclease of toxin-antitoxin system